MSDRAILQLSALALGASLILAVIYQMGRGAGALLYAFGVTI